MTLELRHYQREAIDSLYAYWAEKPDGDPLLVLPTGAGKSLVLGTICDEFIQAEPTTRIAIATHAKELITQNYSELMGICPWAPAGIYSASVGRREAHAQILFVGIQTVHSKAAQIGWVDLLMIDEAHLVSPDSSTMYGVFIAALRAINPNMRVLGLTATPYRMDSGSLIEGTPEKPALFTDIVYEVSIRDLIEWGYLCPLVSKATETTIDLTGVRKSGGDYVAKALQEAADKHATTTAAVDEIIAFGEGRRSWLVFCTGVEHAIHVGQEIQSRGISAATIHGETPKGERDRLIREFKSGKIRALTNANVLTTGFNANAVDLLAMLRPTLSTSLYVQMVGRGTRCIGKDIEESVRNGKTNCLVLDFAGNVRKHGPVDAVKPKRPGKGEGEAPVKECPSCRSLILAGLRECPDCGHEFERNVDDKIQASAAASPILSTSVPEWVPVTGRKLVRNDKPGSTPSVRVEYICKFVMHKEWVCPEHEGFPRVNFERWWKEHHGLNPVPATVDEVCERAAELREVTQIRIKAEGKYWKVLNRRYEPKAADLAPWSAVAAAA